MSEFRFKKGSYADVKTKFGGMEKKHFMTAPEFRNAFGYLNLEKCWNKIQEILKPVSVEKKKVEKLDKVKKEGD